MHDKRGFTLVELMICVAIVAILASVAVPAYINHVNRSRQGQAFSSLLNARLEQEEFAADNGKYAVSISCLPSFTKNTACLSSCDNSCANASTIGKYTVSVESASTTNYKIKAVRTEGLLAEDVLTISASTDTPQVKDTNALKFSVFQWLFSSN